MFAEQTLVEKNDAVLSGMRHSACWALRHFAVQLGEEISETLLFGLGRTAWYCFRAAGRGPHLLTYHPLRVPRMFMALNVPTEVYRCWTSNPLTHHALSGCDGKMLLEVDQSIFGFDQEGKDRFDSFESCVPRHYCVWTTRLVQKTVESEWPHVELRVPYTDDPVIIEGSSLARGWRTPANEMAAYTFYVSHTTGIRWNPPVQTRLAIQQWIHQMRQKRSPYGLGGLDALPAFANSLEDDSANIEQTRRYVLMDGGGAGHRDLLSKFFDEAAEILKDPVLSQTASAYANIATVWRSVLGGTAQGADCVSAIRDIHVLECEALQRLERNFVS